MKTKQQVKLIYVSDIYDENCIITYHLKLSTKALLEASRHRKNVSMTVTSSRYSLGSMGIEFEPTGDEVIDKILDKYTKEINVLVVDASKKEFDYLSKLTSQSFLYKGQFTFNLRSLIHFLELRLESSAHRDIRLLAKMMIDELPEKYKTLIFENKKIKNAYNKTIKWLNRKEEVSHPTAKAGGLAPLV